MRPTEVRTYYSKLSFGSADAAAQDDSRKKFQSKCLHLRWVTIHCLQQSFEKGFFSNNLWFGVLEMHQLARLSTLTENKENSQLRQREGEVGQLRREIARLNEKHEHLLAELSRQSATVEGGLSSLPLDVDAGGKSLPQRYEVLLQLYGQKLEENNELRLDLREAKEAYQSQLTDLLNKLESKR
ncbi:unnamed protein product [Rodentolepis nana]|uniref:TMF_TATA_bd domain-containing protein n=1 Tax=Rodentolepis nana TaxID=102285 RepID=A0A0R3T6M7_RODNA|nr:unnamed protein product [Rodentolepis nana]